MLVTVLVYALVLLVVDCSVRAGGRRLALSLPLALKPTTLGLAKSPSALGGFGMSLVVHLNLPHRLEEEVWVDLVAC